MSETCIVDEMRLGLFRVQWKLLKANTRNGINVQRFRLCGSQSGRDFEITFLRARSRDKIIWNFIKVMKSNGNVRERDSTLINLPSTDSCDAVKLQQEPKRQKLNESEFHFTVPESNLDPVCVWIFLGSEQKSKKFDKSDMNPNDWILLLKDSFQIHEWTLYMDFGTNTATGRKITNGLAQLFYDQNRCDVNFHFKGGQIIGAHILILSAGSPVFSAMFQSCFLESQTRKVNIEDIDPEVFRQLLICLYTGKAPKLAENSITQSLYQAADKYGVDTLKDECVSVLLTNLSSKNAVEILTRSHFHSIPNLFEEAMKCLVNNFREICSQPEWMDLIMKYPNLCLQVNQRLAFLLPPPKKITF